MEKLLRNLKLKDDFTITIPIMKSDFVNKLRRNMDEGSTSSIFPFFEVFSSSKNQYVGSISGNKFELRKRFRFFDTNKGGAIAKGKMNQEGEILNIDRYRSKWI
jgi:Ca2+-binding EF-hand superfamily protein